MFGEVFIITLIFICICLLNIAIAVFMIITSNDHKMRKKMLLIAFSVVLLLQILTIILFYDAKINLQVRFNKIILNSEKLYLVFNLVKYTSLYYIPPILLTGFNWIVDIIHNKAQGNKEK